MRGHGQLALAVVDECLPGLTDVAVVSRMRLEQALAAFSIGDEAALTRCLREAPHVEEVLRPLLEGRVAQEDRSSFRKDLALVVEAVHLSAAGHTKEARARLAKVGRAHRDALHVGAVKAAVTLSAGGRGAPAALGRVLEVLPDADKPGAVAELIRAQPEAAQRLLRRERVLPRHRELATLARAARALEREQAADAGLMLVGTEPLDPSWVTPGAEGTALL